MFVKLGWVVHKKFRKDDGGGLRDKVISQRFSSEEAAQRFKELALKSYLQRKDTGEKDVSFVVEADMGTDHLMHKG